MFNFEHKPWLAGILIAIHPKIATNLKTNRELPLRSAPMNYIALILGRATSVAILVQLCVLLLVAILCAAAIIGL